MKKVSVIIGSPRKGDSYKAIKLLEEKIVNQDSNIEFDYILLKEVELQYCRGCLSCMRKGEQKCPVKDRMIEIRDKLLSSDGFIFSSPVYVHNVTAIIKNFFDRFAYFCHRPQFFGKPSIILCTTELSGLNEALDSMEFVNRTWGLNIVAKMGIFASSFKQEGKYRNNTLLEMDKIKTDFIREINSDKLPDPDFKSLFIFNMLKTKIDLHKDRYKFDYEFWQQNNWFDKKYFYEAKINPLQLAIIKLLLSIRIRMMKKQLDNKF